MSSDGDSDSGEKKLTWDDITHTHTHTQQSEEESDDLLDLKKVKQTLTYSLTHSLTHSLTYSHTGYVT